ncbi:MAG: methionyl-tRNA formyltransferase [Candidatus Omnitrophica bacterium]|nr:methionyl-tRNA formyltransferase [Candidatus Omnitrophota bacterium]
MNIVFFGSGKFAVSPLKALVKNGYKISCVVTQPDKKKGRGLLVESTEIKKAASDCRFEVYQPEQVNSPEAIRFLKDLRGDLFVVIAYGQILSAELINIPKMLAINAHASLLPKYRGAAPINWAIIKGEKTTGVTIIKMSKKMDAGEMILQRTVEIKGEDTATVLEERLSLEAADLLIDTMKSIESNNYKLAPQDEKMVSFAPKLKKQDGLINWGKPARDIYDLIRGCDGWPGAFTYLDKKMVKIYKSGIVKFPVAQFSSGEIIKVEKDGILVATGEDCLKIEELQIEGKRRMLAGEFILGHKVCVGDRLEFKDN